MHVTNYLTYPYIDPRNRPNVGVYLFAMHGMCEYIQPAVEDLRSLG